MKALPLLTALIIIAASYSVCYAQLQDSVPPAQLLLNAVSENNTKEALDLLKRGVKHDIQTVDGVAPIHFAAWNGNLDIVLAIISASGGRRPFPQDKKGASPLHIAAIAGHPVITGVLLQAGHPVGLIDENGMSPLHMAARSGHPEIVRMLITAGARPKTKDRKGWSALSHAAASNSPDVIDELLKYGTKTLLESVDEQGLTALCIAAYSGAFEASQFLLKSGANINPFSSAKTDMTPIFLAVSKNRVKIIELLVNESRGDVLKNMDKSGRNTLHMAAQSGHVDSLRTLLFAFKKHGMPLQVRDKHGLTPLHSAAFAGTPDCVALLLSLDFLEPDPNVRDSKGMTPLHGSAYRGNVVTSKVLLGAGADPDAADNEGQTPMHAAAGSTEVAGETVNVNDEERDQGGQQYEVVKSLLEIGAHPNIMDKNGKYPYEIAVSMLLSINDGDEDEDGDMDMLRNRNQTIQIATLLVPMFRRVKRDLWTADMVKEWLWYIGLDNGHRVVDESGTDEEKEKEKGADCSTASCLQGRIDFGGAKLSTLLEKDWLDMGVKSDKALRLLMEGVGKMTPVIDFMVSSPSDELHGDENEDEDEDGGGKQGGEGEGEEEEENENVKEEL